MENRSPFFVTKLFRRNSRNSESGERNDWGNTADDIIRSNGWGSFSSSTDSGTLNGWGTGLSSKTPNNEANTNGWIYEQPKDEYNGWGSISDAKCVTAKPGNNGQMMTEPPKDGCNGWADGLPEDDNYRCDVAESKPITSETDMCMLPITESRPVPFAPPLPEEDFNGYSSANVSMNDGKDGGASGSSCVVCWEAPVEGACVPCGHMAACMPCLKKMQSKQGTCPVCRAKIDQVMRIYAI